MRVLRRLHPLRHRPEQGRAGWGAAGLQRRRRARVRHVPRQGRMAGRDRPVREVRRRLRQSVSAGRAGGPGGWSGRRRRAGRGCGRSFGDPGARGPGQGFPPGLPAVADHGQAGQGRGRRRLQDGQRLPQAQPDGRQLAAGVELHGRQDLHPALRLRAGGRVPGLQSRGAGVAQARRQLDQGPLPVVRGGAGRDLVRSPSGGRAGPRRPHGRGRLRPWPRDLLQRPPQHALFRQ